MISRNLSKQQLWIHSTAGAWQFESELEHAELFMLTDSADLIFTEHLTMAAFYSATKRRLQIGDVHDAVVIRIAGQDEEIEIEWRK